MLTLVESMDGKVLIDESNRVSVFDSFGDWVSDSIVDATKIFNSAYVSQLIVYVKAEISRQGVRLDTWVSKDFPEKTVLVKCLRRKLDNCIVKYDLYIGVIDD